MRIKNSLWLSVSAVLFACAKGPLDREIDLELTRGYRLISTSSHMVELYHPSSGDNPGVPPKVVRIAWNDRFISVKQQHLTNRNNFPGDSYQIPDGKTFSFWIIDTERTNRFGPYSESEFLQKLNELDQSGLIPKEISKAKK